MYSCSFEADLLQFVFENGRPFLLIGPVLVIKTGESRKLSNCKRAGA